MYFILQGQYDVQSLQFSQEARRKAIIDRTTSSEEAVEVLGPPPGTVRTMSEGSYFGEVSPLIECKRSATVIARSYGTYGALNKDALKTFLVNFPLIKAFMWEHIMSTYDDDLKLFLGESLSKIDYLRKVSK